MTLFAVMAIMAIFAVGLLAVAPSIQQEIQREKEAESIRRGEEVAEAIRQYVEFYRGAKLPNSMDDLIEGLPFGTKKRQILRASAAIDPLIGVIVVGFEPRQALFLVVQRELFGLQRFVGSAVPLGRRGARYRFFIIANAIGARHGHISSTA